MELWTITLSFWLSTWLMLIWRTYPLVMRLVGLKPEGTLIIKYRHIHFVIYSLSLMILTPFIWQVALLDGKRKTWVIAYVNSILGRTKK